MSNKEGACDNVDEVDFILSLMGSFWRVFSKVMIGSDLHFKKIGLLWSESWIGARDGISRQQWDKKFNLETLTEVGTWCRLWW